MSTGVETPRGEIAAAAHYPQSNITSVVLLIQRKFDNVKRVLLIYF